MSNRKIAPAASQVVGRFNDQLPELMINPKTTKMLGLTVPPMLLAQADEVIEKGFSED